MNDTERLKLLVRAVKDYRTKQKAYVACKNKVPPAVLENLLKQGRESAFALDQLIDVIDKPTNTQKSML